MIESYSISPFFLGNPDLKPERSRSVEAGIDQRLARDRAKVEVTWFDNRFSDIISLRTDPATFEAQFFNIGVTRARGVEFGVQAAPIPAIRARASYTLLDSEIVETTSPGNALFAPGQWAVRRPRNSGSIGATIEWQRLSADVNGTFIGRFVDSDFRPVQSVVHRESGAYHLGDASLAGADTTGQRRPVDRQPDQR